MPHALIAHAASHQDRDPTPYWMQDFHRPILPFSNSTRESAIGIHVSPSLPTGKIMNKLYALVVLASMLSGMEAVHAADGGANKAQAEAMVRKGIAFVKANGIDKGYSEISNKSGQFIDRDLYLVVYSLDGTVMAHGSNLKMVGKNLIELKDIDGKAFVKERVDLAKSKGTFWQEYKFTNPETKKIEPKIMYCEKLNDTVVCGGIYL